ncbi:MAG: ABC transporter permease [Candidatus Latescibacteria bacterium]|nr:ABC transporter permease [Candidatus Latescibacterota bacterium]
MFVHGFKMISQFIGDMKKQKLRCFLTMSGITWGTMSVILLLAFGESFRIASMKNMSGMGNNIVVMGGSRTTLPYKGLPPGRYIQLREETVSLLKDYIPDIGYLSPETQKYVTLSIGPQKQNNNCVGVYPGYGMLRNLFPQKGGRFINPLDMENRRRVIFIGTQISEKFFAKESNPVGKILMVNGIPFTVIGVMQNKVQNSSYMTQDKNIVFIPYTTCRDVFGAKYVNRIIFKAKNDVDTPKIKENIHEVLGRRLGFAKDDKDAIWMWDTTEMTQFIHYFFLGFEAFLFLGGVLTLIVGGIGVANIMYVSIRERRREIGIRTALGATPRLILLQFMLESFIIMFIGGSLGVLGAWLIVTLFGSPALTGVQVVLGKPVINLNIALIVATVLALTGFAAGWSPARNASNMDPVRALEF